MFLLALEFQVGFQGSGAQGSGASRVLRGRRIWPAGLKLLKRPLRPVLVVPGHTKQDQHHLRGGMGHPCCRSMLKMILAVGSCAKAL